MTDTTLGDIVVAFAALAIFVTMFSGLWKMFQKAGQPGWGSLIPIYNTFLLVRIAGLSWWWLLLLMIPYAGVIFAIFVIGKVAQNFGKGLWFAVGMFFLPFIFFPILGFGSAAYSSQPKTYAASDASIAEH